MSDTVVETKPVRVKRKKKKRKKREGKIVPVTTKRPKVTLRKKKKVQSPRNALRDSLLYNEDGYAGEGDRGELLLSREQASLDRITDILSNRGILGNRVLLERIQLSRCKKDPMYTTLFFSNHTDTNVVGKEGVTVPLIDFLLDESFKLLKDTLGEMFTSLDLIMNTYRNLMMTNDTHAKIWLFLYIMQREKPIQDMMFKLYTDEEYTSHRLVHFLQKLGPLIEQMIALPYTDAINDFNVKNMIRSFLTRCISEYMLYTKDPRYSMT